MNVVREQSAAELASARKLGFEVHALTPVQREEWRRATAGVTQALIDDIGGEAAQIHDLIQRGKAEFQPQSTTAVPLMAPRRRSASASGAADRG